MNPIIRNYKAGSLLFHENDRSRDLYIIQSGDVKIYRTISGKEIEIATLGKGSVLGEMALIDKKPRSASAKAITDCTAVLIDADAFSEKIAGVPPWFMTIIKMACQKIRTADSRLRSTQPEYVNARIVIAILYLFRKYQYNGTIHIKSISSNLINLLGVTEKSVTDTISFLCRNNFALVKNDELTIIAFSQYCEYCDFLHLLIRKAYNCHTSPPPDIIRMITELSNDYIEILHGDNPQTVIDGDKFWQVICKCNLEKSSSDIIARLKTDGFLTFVKSEVQPSRNTDNPLLGYLFKINNSKWKKYCLYEKFGNFEITV